MEHVLLLQCGILEYSCHLGMNGLASTAEVPPDPALKCSVLSHYDL